MGSVAWQAAGDGLPDWQPLGTSHEQPVQWEIRSFRRRRKGTVSDPPSRIASFLPIAACGARFFGRGLDA
jgi:hypothetical protein